MAAILNNSVIGGELFNFNLGDGKKFSYGIKEYTNGKLEYEATYMVFQRVYVKEVSLLEKAGLFLIHVFLKLKINRL